MVCTTFLVCQTLTEEILLDQSCQSISFYTSFALNKMACFTSSGYFLTFSRFLGLLVYKS